MALLFNPLYASVSKMHTLANSEDSDEMLHNVSFHQGLHYLLRQSSEKVIQFLF